MHSPTKNANLKKTRKNNTFSQATISHSEVGNFQGGYFVMPEASKDNDHKARNNSKIERSPARRKHQTPNILAASSPTTERALKSDAADFTKPLPPSLLVETKHKDCITLLSPGSFSAPQPKLAQVLVASKQAQYYEHNVHKHSPPSSPSKDIMSTSPPASGRWAGPAFGNAPHPSTLPLPEWTSETSLSSSPPVHDGGRHLQGIAYQTSNSSYPSSPQTPHLSSSPIPVVPFPYIGSVPPPILPSPPSLDQLSTDLRRLLNINGGPIINIDPILVSANSA